MDWQLILDKAKTLALAYGPSVLGALATLVLGWLGARVLRSLLGRGLRRARVDPTLVGFVCNLTFMLVMAFVIVSALGSLGMATGSFVAIIGAAGLAIGFALQGSLSNLAAGVMIILFRPLRAGDFVEAAGVKGTVVEILVFSTVLNTPDNRRIIVPNSKLLGDVITNYSVNPTRRVDLVVGIGYDDDLKRAKELLLEICRAHPLVLDDPAPAVFVTELADSSVNFNVRPWCKQTDYWTVWGDLTEAVKLRFGEAGISIPFPQRDVHLHQVA